MAALKRSLAQDIRQSAARRPRKSEPGPQQIVARLIATTDSRRPKKEGGARDRAGSRRHEAAKGLSAARQHFCENGSRWVLLSTRRLWRRTKHDGVALTPHALSHELWSSDRSFVLQTPLLFVPLDRAGRVARLWFVSLRNRPGRIDPAHHSDRCRVVSVRCRA